MSREVVTDAVSTAAHSIVSYECENAENQPANSQHDGHAGTPLPRPKRRRRRAKADRGLPSDGELAKLATVYLKRQQKHWPMLASSGLLPEPQSDVVRQMVEDFKDRHRTGNVDVETVKPFLTAGAKLAGGYSRYSCDNSSPNSVIDQMVNELDKAHDEGRFIPWQYVFADFSVTGLDATRQGYSSYKAVLADRNNFIETTYIDDFTRPSRDEIEWWKLAALSKRLTRRMIGASDGFDISSPDWDLKITIYGLLSRLFIKSLREKVRRGMRGAARRKTCLGKLSLGFTRRPRLDVDGNMVIDSDGMPVHERCIDPATRDFVLLLYKLFVEQSWSAYKIAKHFNQIKVDDWSGWTERAIKQLLASPASIGVFIWNRKRQEFDYEAEKMVVVKNPRSEWVVDYDPDLAIVPMDLWRAARRKLAEMRRASLLTGKKQSRNQNSATTLFSGTLFCEDCKKEITLIRSTEKYKQMGCLNGTKGAHDCRLSSSKSTREIESCLVGFLRDKLLTEERMDAIVAAAKSCVEEEAKKPVVDTAPMKAEVRRKEAAIKRLVQKVEETDDKSLSQGYDKRIKELQRDANLLYANIREADARNRKSVPPLDGASASTYLRDLRSVLETEIPIAAEALRQLTGPITIRQEAIPGKKNRARWIARFSPDLIRLLRHVSKDDSLVANLHHGVRNGSPPVDVIIERIPKYEELAPKFRQLQDDGASIASIAGAHGMSKQFAAKIIHFAHSGERPKWKAGKRTGMGGNQAKFREIADEVARLRDEEKMSFESIAERLSVSAGTVNRAYDHARPTAVQRAVKEGKRARRGSYSRLGEAKYTEVRELLNNGESAMTIATKVGCGSRTVYRIRRQLRDERRNVEADRNLRNI